MVQEVLMGGTKFTAKGIDLDKELGACHVKKPAWGRYTRVLFEKNPMHDRAWDKMINDSASGMKRKRIFSYVPGMFWAYKLKGTDRSGASWKRVLLKDKIWGRASSSKKVAVGSKGCSGCGCGGTKYQTTKYEAINGQQSIFSKVTSSTTIHDGLKAYFQLAGEKPEEQFQGMQMLVAGNDDKQLAALKSLATITDPTALEAKIMEIRTKAYAYGKADGVKAEQGLADAAALLAATALRQIAKMRDQSSKKCKKLKYTGDISAWAERANTWLKIARRLAHGEDALHYAKYGAEAARDPIFDENQTSFACADTKMQAKMMFSAGGDALTISGPVKAYLKSSYEAAFGCTGKGGRIVIKPPIVTTKKCKGLNEILVGKKCVCKPRTKRWKGTCLPSCKQGYVRVSMTKCKVRGLGTQPN